MALVAATVTLGGCVQQVAREPVLDAAYRVDEWECDLGDVRRPLDVWLFEVEDACAFTDLSLISNGVGCDECCEAQRDAVEMLENAQVMLLRYKLFPAVGGSFEGEYSEEWCECGCSGAPYLRGMPVVWDYERALDRGACQEACEDGPVWTQEEIEEIDDITFHVAAYGDDGFDGKIQYTLDGEPVERAFLARACLP